MIPDRFAEYSTSTKNKKFLSATRQASPPPLNEVYKFESLSQKHQMYRSIYSNRI